MFSIHNPIGFGSIQEVITTIIRIAFAAAGLIAGAYLIVGGYRYMTSSGNQEAAEGAKATIVNSIIGLIIIFASFLIVNYILQSLNIEQLEVVRAEPASQFAQAGVEPAPGAGTGDETEPKTGNEGNIPKLPEGIVPEGEGRTIQNPLGENTPQNIIDNILAIAFGLAGIIAVAYLIIGGYQYITSQGNPDVAAQAKSTIVNSIIGLIIVLTAYLIVRFVLIQLHAEGILG
jgi:TRAP-type C4-dicarboxylate transport system permease small subunit